MMLHPRRLASFIVTAMSTSKPSTINFWLSSIQPSGILIQLANISKKFFHFYEVNSKIKFWCSYVHRPHGSSSIRHQQWYPSASLMQVSIVQGLLEFVNTLQCIHPKSFSFQSALSPRKMPCYIDFVLGFWDFLIQLPN